jgi:DNA-binding LytR/AlgR family response regulator
VKVEIVEGHTEVEVIVKCPQATEDINRMVSVLQGFDNMLSGTKDGRIHLIDVKEVLYFESVDKRSFIYMDKDVYETLFKLYEIEEHLSDKGFIRSAKSQILNIARIKSLCPDFGGRIEVELCNGERLTVTRSYSKSLKERLGLR